MLTSLNFLSASKMKFRGFEGRGVFVRNLAESLADFLFLGYLVECIKDESKRLVIIVTFSRIYSIT